MPFFRSVLKQDTGGGGEDTSSQWQVQLIANNGETILPLASYSSFASSNLYPEGNSMPSSHFNSGRDINTVIIGDYVYNCANFFYLLESFNGNVIVGNHVYMCRDMFSGLFEFNSPVEFNHGPIYAQSMFNRAISFNQPFNFPEGTTWAQEAFNGCRSLNKPITLANSTLKCDGLLSNCSKFNQRLVIPANVDSCASLLANCTNFSNSVYFKGTVSRTLNVYNMFGNIGDYLRKNIWFNRALNSVFNSGQLNSSTIISWTSMTNGFYNSARNIYCYYNYDGVSDPV